MGTRGHASRWAALAIVGLLAGTAAAGPKDDIQSKSKEAMEAYDLMDYAGAKKQLTSALATAKKAKLDKDPVAAKVHLYLGIAAFADGDADTAKSEFAIAVKIDPKIQIDAAYKSPELTKLLDSVRGGGGDTDGGSEPDPDPPAGGGDVDCISLKGLQHTPVDRGKAGANEKIEAYLGSDVEASRVVVAYRVEGSDKWSESKLSKDGDCKYVGQIPGSAKKGSLIHYYVAAYGEGPKPVASRGSEGAPEIMELTAGGPNDGEDPIGGGEEKGGDVSGGVLAGGKPPKVYIAIAGGTGFGYVTGKTEFGNMVQNCCIGNSLVVITPELGFYASPQLAIGLAARIGLPIGANVMGHSSVAPGGLVRLRYAFAKSGQGLRAMAQLGGGFLRNTIKLDNSEPGMDTDIVAQGPLLVGAGLGFTKKLGSTVAFVADLSVIAGIAVIDNLDGSALNNGVSADLSLGFAVGF